MFLKDFKKIYSEEELEWMMMSPQERLKESGKLWHIYLSLGGILDPEPDLQSPFYFPEKQSKSASHRRTSNHTLRRV